jgi:hypothetical protein
VKEQAKAIAGSAFVVDQRKEKAGTRENRKVLKLNNS